MRQVIALVAVVGLVSGPVGAWASGQLSGSAGAAPTAQQVREQNVDGSGFIRTHEQGTANVNVTNGPLPVSGTVNVGNFPAPAQGRLISLGTQTASTYRSAFVDVSDCEKATIMVATSNQDTTLYINPQVSPDGNQAVGLSPDGNQTETFIDGVNTRSISAMSVVAPFMRVEAAVNPAVTSNFTAWIWCEP